MQLIKKQNGYVPLMKYCYLQFINMATYSSQVTIFWSIFDACYTSKHPFFSGFEAEKGLHVIHACVVYTMFYGKCYSKYFICLSLGWKHCEKGKNAAYQHSLLFHVFKRQILDSFKPKEFADDNFKFGENGTMFSKRVENTVRRGQIAHNKQFLCFPQCFPKICTTDM